HLIAGTRAVGYWPKHDCRCLLNSLRRHCVGLGLGVWPRRPAFGAGVPRTTVLAQKSKRSRRRKSVFTSVAGCRWYLPKGGELGHVTSARSFRDRRENPSEEYNHT